VSVNGALVYSAPKHSIGLHCLNHDSRCVHRKIHLFTCIYLRNLFIYSFTYGDCKPKNSPKSKTKERCDGVDVQLLNNVNVGQC